VKTPWLKNVAKDILQQVMFLNVEAGCLKFTQKIILLTG